MKEVFAASLCRGGILGGGIIVEDERMVYKTGKVTVSPQYRNIEMNYRDIQSISKGWLLLFPTVSVTMSSGESFRFIVFSRQRFLWMLESKGVH